jgi:hypothetical protein
MTERAGRMPEETGDDDAAEFGIMESPAEGTGGGLGVGREVSRVARSWRSRGSHAKPWIMQCRSYCLVHGAVLTHLGRIPRVAAPGEACDPL